MNYTFSNLKATMEKILIDDVRKYVEQHIGAFHEKRIQALEMLRLDKVLKRKNPYLFKAKNMLTAEQIVKGFIDAHLSSHEETIFGNWLEGLAIFINQKVYKGWKSGIPGIDLEFNKNNIRYIVNIKSVPNWGNSSQIKKMIQDFKTAKKTLRTGLSNLQIIAVNGCCYGKDNKPDKGDYYKYCGQKFWEFLSGNSSLYTEIIEPLGHQAKEKNEVFLQNYAQKINQLTLAFGKKFCDQQGKIYWERLVEYNSKA